MIKSHKSKTPAAKKLEAQEVNESMCPMDHADDYREKKLREQKAKLRLKNGKEGCD